MGAKQMAMGLNLDKIRKKGALLGLTYMQALSVYLFEEILYRLSRTSLGERLWLKPFELSLFAKNKKSVPNGIVSYMKDISYEELEEAIGSVEKQKKRESLDFSWQLLFFDRQLEIVMSVEIDSRPVPFKLIVRPVWQCEQFPEEARYQPLLELFPPINYKAYPQEMNLAESFYEVLDKLELIPDMQPYGEICHILRTAAVDGRRTYLNLKELLDMQPMTSREKRWETVRGYRSYAYMAGRWDKYRKNFRKKKGTGPGNQRRKEAMEMGNRENTGMDVSWPELMALMDAFFTPLWNGMLEDGIFFGDWMPHLGRYLD